MTNPPNVSRSLSALLALVVAHSIGGALGGCAKMDAPSGSASPTVAANQARAGEPGLAAADRAMRITIETTVEVKDIEAASAATRAAVSRAHGYVGEARASRSDDARHASFEVHVPTADLPAFRAEIAKMGEVVSDAEKAEDVTEQRADIKARLGNARAAEKRLLDLLGARTGTLSDVVAIEKELTSVRETVERMEAQERVLEGQIALATVKIQLVSPNASSHIGTGTRIARAGGDGVRYAGSFLVGLAVIAASSGPTVLVIAAIGYVIFLAARSLARRSRKNG